MARASEPIKIDLIPTGVPNLDPILGGGLPALSLTVIAGPAGSGKTTLAQQIAFHNATPEHPAVHFATLGEPAVKLLRYQQQFSFFDNAKVGRAVHFVDLSETMGEGGTTKMLEKIREYVERLSPAFVIIDSFRAIEDLGGPAKRIVAHQLAMQLATWQCTGFLVGEYNEAEVGVGPEFTIADNVILLTHDVQRNISVRRLRVVKLRGQAALGGRHTFRITRDGLQVYPHLAEAVPLEPVVARGRATFGIPGLDEMLHGGIPRGQTTLVAGASGTGKTLLALHFVVEGARLGEPAVMATFEESPAEHAEKMAAFGWDLADLERRGLVQMVYLRPVDLTMDEVTNDIMLAVARVKAQRVVVNSISGLSVALPTAEREDLREGLYHLGAYLNRLGITTILTTEVPDMFGQVRLSMEGISFLADNTILLRFVEIESELRKALMVVKMRTSDHDKELREYTIGKRGLVVAKSFSQYSGVMTGIPTLRTLLEPQPFTAGLTDQQEAVMRTLLALREATAQELAEALGGPLEDTQAALDRLLDTGYVVAVTRGGRRIYRVALVTPGSRPQGR